MEWKLDGAKCQARFHGALETFLGGMETSSSPYRFSCGPTLETFLGGMETRRSLMEGKGLFDLETFLSGMETPAVPPSPISLSPLKPSLVEWKLRGRNSGGTRGSCLETFLSGMET